MDRSWLPSWFTAPTGPVRTRRRWSPKTWMALAVNSTPCPKVSVMPLGASVRISAERGRWPPALRRRRQGCRSSTESRNRPPARPEPRGGLALTLLGRTACEASPERLQVEAFHHGWVSTGASCKTSATTGPQRRRWSGGSPPGPATPGSPTGFRSGAVAPCRGETAHHARAQPRPCAPQHVPSLSSAARACAFQRHDP